MTDARRPGRSLRRSVAYAFAALVVAVATTAVSQFVRTREVHHDVERLFEELREVALVRALVDELRGVEHWVRSAADARASSQPLVFRDVLQHRDAALATLGRFTVAADPSTPEHDSREDLLVREVDDAMRLLASALDGGGPLAAIEAPVGRALHAAMTLEATIESESRAIGDELDRNSDDMAQGLLFLGVASLLLLGGLGWLLLRRVLEPVRTLRQAAIRLGQGDLDVPIVHPHDDELGDLAATLHTMAGRLRESRDELEARVEARSREVLRSASLAQLGTLAAGIAHEINNPLASIVAAAEGLLRDLDRGSGTSDDPGTREYLQILHKEGLRARDITTRLLRFARHDEPRREPVALAEEAREVTALFAHQCQDAGVRCEVLDATHGATISGDPAAWRQVLFNLLRNALDASPRGGTIRVLVRREPGELQLVVADDGPGVGKADEDRIFEPFFTTKEPGKGTGLGLAIVHRIVEAHGGRIAVANAQHGARGACFTITLPHAG